MAPTTNSDISKPTGDGLILEAWGQGFLVGSLVIMAFVTVSNMRRGILLHKLILIELVFGMIEGTFIFSSPPVYGWYEGVGALFLNTSWIMHNVIAYLKNKPFLSKKVSIFYISTVILSVPYWIVEVYANFTFFNNINTIFKSTRPYEVIFRDPWWVFTICNLFWNIKRRYEFGLLALIKVSPRFGVLLLSMCLSVGFIIVDLLSVTDVISSSLPKGINPFWKLAFIFKCLTDTIILDDFKTALDRLKEYNLQRNTISMASEDHHPHTVSRAPMTPYNESRGMTDSEEIHLERGPGASGTASKHKQELVKDEFAHIDLEMAYWTGQNRAGS